MAEFEPVSPTWPVRPLSRRQEREQHRRGNEDSPSRSRPRPPSPPPDRPGEDDGHIVDDYA